MPWTPDSSTWSAALNASSTLTCRSEIDSSRSFGMTISVSTSSRSRSMPRSAWAARRLPSKPNGRVTTPIVSAPSERATLATTGRAAGAGPAALASGDEDHVGALEDLLDLLAVILGGLAADVRVGARAQAAGELPADVELDVGVTHQQGLRIGIDRDELNALESLVDHPVHGIDAAPADTDDLNDRQIVLRCCHEEEPFRSSASMGISLAAFAVKPESSPAAFRKTSLAAIRRNTPPIASAGARPRFPANQLSPSS